MALHKREVRSGAVLEKEYYGVHPNVKDPRKAEPRKPKARTPEEQAEINRRQSLKRFIRLINTNFGPWAFYVTLTFDDAHLPANFKEARRMLDNYVRRLQYVAPKLKLAAVMGRGRKTGRIHAHLVISGVDKNIICAKWQNGGIKKAVRLRAHNIYEGVDCGRDYTGLATYLFDHWTEEQGGKRWKQIKLEQPAKSNAIPAKLEYSVDAPPPAPEGYRLIRARRSSCERGAYLCFTYTLLDDRPDIPYH